MRSQNVKRAVLLVTAISLVLAVFSPAVMPLLWHLRYGYALEYRDKIVLVPGGWYPRTQFRGLDISKPALTVFSLGSPPPAWSFLSPLSVAPSRSVEETYRSFETYYRAYRATSDNAVTGPLRMGHGNAEATCMEQSSIQDGKYTIASCLLFGGTWQAEFVGETSEVQNFLRVVRETKDK